MVDGTYQGLRLPLSDGRDAPPPPALALPRMRTGRGGVMAPPKNKIKESSTPSDMFTRNVNGIENNLFVDSNLENCR